MSIQVMSKVWDADCGSHTAKLVLLAIADHADDKGLAWPSITGIASKCNMSRRGVMNQVQKLTDMGYLASKKSHGRNTKYTIQLVNLVHQCTPCTSEPRAKTGERGAQTGERGAPEPSINIKEPSKGVEPSDEGFQFAEWFLTLRPATMKATKAELKKWAKEYDALQRLDGKTKDQIKAVCKWARNDDFWKKNVFSPNKLRKKNGDGIKYFDVFQANLRQQSKSHEPRPV